MNKVLFICEIVVELGGADIGCLPNVFDADPGEVILIRAMNDGVGTLLSDWARSIGAIVIGTVGSAAKKGLA